MAGSNPRPLRSAIFRSALGLTAISLVFYVPFRYITRPPGFGGVLDTAYALLFPLSVLLAVAALRASWRPGILAGLDASSGSAGRWILGVYGGSWVLMGLMCLPSLTSLAAHSPVEGLLASVHMTAQHVFLGFVAVACAADPAAGRALLEGESVREAWGSEDQGHATDTAGTV